MSITISRVLCKDINNKQTSRKNRFMSNQNIVLYADVEFKNQIIDVQVEQTDYNMSIKDIYENNTDNLITRDFSDSDMNVINEIMKFELGY